MIYFTSDWHLGEERIGINNKPNLFHRPFKSITEQNNTILTNLCNIFKDGDTLWHLGDVINGNIEIAELKLKELKILYPNATLNLIIGNYDVDKINLLKKYFNNIYEDYNLNIDNKNIYLNHYPTKCLKQLTTNNPFKNIYSFAITGHIHGLWKIQEKLINVGVDAWNYNPVSLEQILFTWNAMQNHYDNDVFPYKNKP